MPRPRRSGSERFAEDFSVLLAQEGLKAGKIRLRTGKSLFKWAEQTLRGSHGDMATLGRLVGIKLFCCVYGPVGGRVDDRKHCQKRGWMFARRHRLILAEQVLAGNVTEPQRFNLQAEKDAVLAEMAEIREKAKRGKKEKRRRA